MYSGRDESRTTSVASSVVIELCNPLLDQERTLYCDNWYTSVGLATTLLSLQTHTVGTLRSNRLHKSQNLTNEKLRKDETKAEQSNNGIVMMKWRDQRDVLVLSTRHGPEMKEFTQRRGTAVMKPEIVIDYNKSKAFIDLSDQMTAYSPYFRRTVKWYRRLALEVITGTCMVNLSCGTQYCEQK